MALEKDLAQAIGAEQLARVRALAEVQGRTLEDLLSEAVNGPLEKEEDSKSALGQDLNASIERYRTLYERLAK